MGNTGAAIGQNVTGFGEAVAIKGQHKSALSDRWILTALESKRLKITGLYILKVFTVYYFKKSNKLLNFIKYEYIYSTMDANVLN